MTITGLEFHPGNRRIVHHSRIHLDETGDARSREADRPDAGLLGLDGSEDRGAAVSGPGRLDARSDPSPRARGRPGGRSRGARTSCCRSTTIPPARSRRDRSSVGLYFAKQPVTRTMAGLSISTDQIDIPAGSETPRDHPVRLAEGRHPALHRRAPRPLPLPRVPPGRHVARRHRSARCSGSPTGISTGRTSIVTPGPSACRRGRS